MFHEALYCERLKHEEFEQAGHSLQEAFMRAEDLRTGEVLIPTGEGGFPLFAGSRMMIMGTRSLGQMQEDVYRILGVEKAGGFLFQHGYDAGLATAMAMADLYDWESDEEWLKAGTILRSVAGLAHERVDTLAFHRGDNTLRMEGSWRDSLEATQRLRQKGTSADPVCHILSGVSSGYASGCLGSEVWVREVSCRAQGHRVCRFEGRPLHEWDEEPGTKGPFHALDSMETTMERLREQLRQAWKEVENHRAELSSLKETSRAGPDPAEGLVFRSDAMAQVMALAERVASTDATVLIHGESGTGKEVLVRFIHRHSARREESLLAVDCAALPENLLESELFGHVKGSFTGADRDKTGLFVEAAQGTLLLDEVAELPLTLQAKLLRSLQERVVRPVGSVKPQPVHARIIASTNRDLKVMVQEGSFREDLYYRLAVIPILVPPLRERRQDILPLARHFLERFRPQGEPGFSPEAVRMLTSYSWPGNVRELENAVEHASILAGADRIMPEHLPEVAKAGEELLLDSLASDLPSQEELVRRYTERVLAHTKGNRTQAAKILNVHLSTLWRRLKPNG